MVRKTKEEALQTRQQLIDAARRVFHRHGVSRSSLEQVAREAGLTRGALYWHFKNKIELFSAMREDAFVPMEERITAILLSDDYSDPLEAIETSLTAFFKVLDECPTVRQVMEIMVLRCENVEEFSEVQQEAERPAEEFRDNLEKAYTKAKAGGYLRPGLDPALLALDTWAFTSGLLHGLLSCGFEKQLKSRIGPMIAGHMALRRSA
ncbi:MAG: TetR family transcriptional regulator [Pseudomonadota bacterium]